MDFKRVTLLAGHYGSGKTNLAVNLARMMRLRYDRVTVADLDIVNPYFRSADSADELKDLGIRLIVSPYANTNLDAPALPQEMYSIVDDRSRHVIIDVGGDERGALALGRISGRILEENDYDMFLIVNRFRPLTRDAESVREVMAEIETACGLPFTGIVNNSNLGAETVPATVLSSLSYADEIRAVTGLPVVATAVEDTLYPALRDEIPDLIPMKLQKRPID